MKNANSLRSYLRKGSILSLVAVLTIGYLPSISLAAPAKKGKAQISRKPIRNVNRIAQPASRGDFVDAYTLGPGDRLRVDIFNVPEYSGEFAVLADGTINLPLIGAVRVEGQTIRRTADILSSKFVTYVKTPRVTISLLAPRPVQVAIAGEISRAGSYTIPFTLENRKFPTVSQIIQLAGGTNQNADLRRVQVRRGGSNRGFVVNIFDVLQRGNTAQDISLRDGDTIFIPRSTDISSSDRIRVAGSNLANQDTAIKVAVVGEVGKPGTYTLKGESNGSSGGTGRVTPPTLTEAIKIAGGSTPSADLTRVRVRRNTRTREGRDIGINLISLLKDGDFSQDIILQDGDTIVLPTSSQVNNVYSSLISASNLGPQSISPVKVVVVGEVNRPGTYTVRGDANTTNNNTQLTGTVALPTVAQAIQSASGLKQTANIRNITLTRTTRSGQQKITLNLSELLRSGDNSQDIILQEGDLIRIPASPQGRNPDSRLIASSSLGAQSITPVKVVVFGEVNRPGSYTVKVDPNTVTGTQITGNIALPSVTQAIQAAAGIKPTANIRKIVLTRTTSTGDEQQINIDLFALLQTGDSNQDILLQEGDRIDIPFAESMSAKDVELLASSTLSPATIKVNVIGEISTKFPKGNLGTIEMPPNTTLNQAILIAGGFDNVRANKNQVDFIRLNPNGTVTKRLISLNFAKGIDNEVNPRLQNNDTIVIGRSNLTRIGDGFSSVLTPFAGIFSLFNIFK